MDGWLLFFLTFTLWAVVHSLTAARAVKVWVRRRVGERVYAGFYRLAYNVISVLTFLPLLYVLAVAVSSTVVWRVAPPWSFLFLAVQGVGFVGIVLSLIYTDVWSFLGLRQAWRYWQGEAEPAPAVSFTSRGPYALVRHPLYFFSLLFIWFSPLMTVNGLLFNLLTTLYFWLGSLHEERRLEAAYGEQYRRYRTQVPALFPWPRRRTAT